MPPAYLRAGEPAPPPPTVDDYHIECQGKIVYRARTAAERAIRRDHRLRTCYRCTYCGRWHTSKKPKP